MVELIRMIKTLILGEAPRPIPALKKLSDEFVGKLVEKDCRVVVIIPKRVVRWGCFNNILIFKGVKSGIHDKILANHREVCFISPPNPNSKETRRNRAELHYMAEKRGRELQQLLPDLEIRVFDLEGKPMSTAERAKICAVAEGLNISI